MARNSQIAAKMLGECFQQHEISALNVPKCALNDKINAEMEATKRSDKLLPSIYVFDISPRSGILSIPQRRSVHIAVSGSFSVFRVTPIRPENLGS